MAGYRVEMSPLESFCFGIKHLWQADEGNKAKLRIVDTVVYQEGRPLWWLFTSQKTGEVLRKKAERMQSSSMITEILTTFKNKSHGYRGYKPVDLRSKIALVWFMRNNERDIASYLVDEHELLRILKSKLEEIIAIQIYMGGHHAQGNGVFSHKIWRLKNGQLKHQSYEAVEAAYDTNLSQYSAIVKQLIVQDFQTEIMKSLGLTLTKFYESIATANIEFFSFQVAFDSSWNPHLIGVRDIIFMDAPQDFLDEHDMVIYINGKKPKCPAFSEESLMLPRPMSEYAGMIHNEREELESNAAIAHAELLQGGEHTLNFKEHGTTGTSTVSGAENSPLASPNSHESNPARWRKLRGSVTTMSFTKQSMLSRKKSQLRSLSAGSNNGLATMKHQLSNGEIMTIPPPDPNGPPSYHETPQLVPSQQICNSTAQASAAYRAKQQGTPVTTLSAKKKKALSQSTATSGDEESEDRGYTSGAGGLVAESVHLTEFRQKECSASNLLVHDFEDRQRERAMLATGNTTDTMTNALRTGGSALSARSGQSGVNYPYMAASQPHYLTQTELNRLRNTHEDEDHSLVGGNKEDISRHFHIRRPITAPHYTHRNFGKTSHVRPKEASHIRVTAAAAMYNSLKNADINVTSNSYGESNIAVSLRDVKEAPHDGGTFLWKTSPIGSTSCFGDFCCFEEYAASKLTEATNKTLDGSKTIGTSGHYQNHARSMHCPYQMPYKSILLCRSEGKFLETVPLDANIDSIVVRQKLATLETGQLYTYFVRRHMNKVAQKCQEEGRRFAFSSQGSSAPMTCWHDLNAVYRSIVYSAALGSVHPSRFYHTVPLCETCYKIYYFMDLQRENTIMHNPDQNLALLGGAAPPTGTNGASLPHSTGASRPRSASGRRSPRGERPRSAPSVLAHRKGEKERSSLSPRPGDRERETHGTHGNSNTKLRVAKMVHESNRDVTEMEDTGYTLPPDKVIFSHVLGERERATSRERPRSAIDKTTRDSRESVVTNSARTMQPGAVGVKSDSALPPSKGGTGGLSGRGERVRPNGQDVVIRMDAQGRVQVEIEGMPNGGQQGESGGEGERETQPQPPQQPRLRPSFQHYYYSAPEPEPEREEEPLPPIAEGEREGLQLDSNKTNPESTRVYPSEGDEEKIVVSPAEKKEAKQRVKNLYGFHSLPFDDAPVYQYMMNQQLQQQPIGVSQPQQAQPQGRVREKPNRISEASVEDERETLVARESEREREKEREREAMKAKEAEKEREREREREKVREMMAKENEREKARQLAQQRERESKERELRERELLQQKERETDLHRVRMIEQERERERIAAANTARMAKEREPVHDGYYIPIGGEGESDRPMDIELGGEEERQLDLQHSQSDVMGDTPLDTQSYSSIPLLPLVPPAEGNEVSVPARTMSFSQPQPSVASLPPTTSMYTPSQSQIHAAYQQEQAVAQGFIQQMFQMQQQGSSPPRSNQSKTGMILSVSSPNSSIAPMELSQSFSPFSPLPTTLSFATPTGGRNSMNGTPGSELSSPFQGHQQSYQLQQQFDLQQ